MSSLFDKLENAIKESKGNTAEGTVPTAGENQLGNVEIVSTSAVAASSKSGSPTVFEVVQEIATDSFSKAKNAVVGKAVYDAFNSLVMEQITKRVNIPFVSTLAKDSIAFHMVMGVGMTALLVAAVKTMPNSKQLIRLLSLAVEYNAFLIGSKVDIVSKLSEILSGIKGKTPEELGNEALDALKANLASK